MPLPGVIIPQASQNFAIKFIVRSDQSLINGVPITDSGFSNITANVETFNCDMIRKVIGLTVKENITGSVSEEFIKLSKYKPINMHIEMLSNGHTEWRYIFTGMEIVDHRFNLSYAYSDTMIHKLSITFDTMSVKNNID